MDVMLPVERRWCRERKYILRYYDVFKRKCKNRGIIVEMIILENAAILGENINVESCAFALNNTYFSIVT